MKKLLIYMKFFIATALLLAGLPSRSYAAESLIKNNPRMDCCLIPVEKKVDTCCTDKATESGCCKPVEIPKQPSIDLLTGSGLAFEFDLKVHPATIFKYVSEPLLTLLLKYSFENRGPPSIWIEDTIQPRAPPAA